MVRARSLRACSDKQAGLVSRVAGDALDIVSLMPALSRDNPKRGNAALALVMVIGVTLLDSIAAEASVVRHNGRSKERKLYSDRSGFPKGVEAARGAARDGSEHTST